ncbi:MAG: translation elongation factor Ts [Holosporales bacterium]|jgi:elongation factor Ts|nr:translation elongation factor Ts [Holosporales bacterium]
MEITAQLVKQLRDKTGAGMMDCKRALIDTSGDLQAAEEHLRKKGLMDAAKKASRAAADGLVACAVSSDKRMASVIEVNSETDFVARNEKFQELVAEIAEIALSTDDVLNAKSKGNCTISEEISQLISLIGENISFRRSKKVRVEHGIVAAYIHNAIKPGMGKIGVLIALEAKCCQCSHSESSPHSAELEDLGRKLAMHVAAANPTYLCPSCVPQEVIAKEKEIVIAQAKELGKPDAIAEKMADGRVKKFLEECTLLEQIYVVDGKSKISSVLETSRDKIGCEIKIASFTRFVLGEGIEKDATNFAEEVGSFLR